jgi:hypothetical protein
MREKWGCRLFSGASVAFSACRKEVRSLLLSAVAELVFSNVRGETTLLNALLPFVENDLITSCRWMWRRLRSSGDDLETNSTLTARPRSHLIEDAHHE